MMRRRCAADHSPMFRFDSCAQLDVAAVKAASDRAVELVETDNERLSTLRSSLQVS